eukprot:scaffold22842_cov18-Tisochrysis_lutea.AAC.1
MVELGRQSSLDCPSLEGPEGSSRGGKPYFSPPTLHSRSLNATLGAYCKFRVSVLLRKEAIAEKWLKGLDVGM